MWTASGEIIPDVFSPDLGRAIHKMAEIAQEQTSRKVGPIELLLTIFEFDENDFKKQLNDDQRSLVFNIKTGLKKYLASETEAKDCTDLLEYLVERRGPSEKKVANFYRKDEWSNFTVVIFDRIERLPGSNDFILGQKIEKLSDVNFAIFAYLIFSEMNGIEHEGLSGRKELLTLLNLSGLVKWLEDYIQNMSNTLSVYDETGTLIQRSFNENSYEIVTNAHRLAENLGYKELNAIHILLALLSDRDGFGCKIFNQSLPPTISIETAKKRVEQFVSKGLSPVKTNLPLQKASHPDRVQKIFSDALHQSKVLDGQDFITVKQLTISMVSHGGDILKNVLYNTLKIPAGSIPDCLNSIDETAKKELFLPDDLGTCMELTEMNGSSAAADVIGREKEVDEVLRILHRKTNHNVMLYGEKGVGKTAVATAISNEIKKGRVGLLKNLPVVYFDLKEIPEKDIPAKCGRLFSYMKEFNRRIYIVDNFNKFFGQCEDECKFHLRQNKYFFIGIVSESDFIDIMKKEIVVREFFDFVKIDEPSTEIMIDLLKIHGPHIAEEYHVKFEDGLIEKSVRLARDFLIADKFPQKAIGLLQAACDEVTYSWEEYGAKPIVRLKNIASRISAITGLPIEVVLGTGGDKDYREILGKEVVGQERAVEQVADALDRIQAGLVDKTKPPAIFLFIGLSGTGKTELAKALARVYSRKKTLITYTMENFQESHNVSGLIGTSAGYIGYEEGGKLINDLNNDPYAVVLLDEAEKAHPSIWDPFINLFDEGLITDLKGRTAYGNKAFFIMTSNIAAVEICKMMAAGKPINEIEEVVLDQLYKQRHKKSGELCFRPEFIGRILRRGGIVVFNALSKEAVRGIAQNMIDKMCSEWNFTRNSSLSVCNEVVALIADKCHQQNEADMEKAFDAFAAGKTSSSDGPQYKGGRYVAKVIEDLVTNPLSKNIRELANAKEIRVVLKEGVVILDYEKDAARYEQKLANRVADMRSKILKAVSGLKKIQEPDLSGIRIDDMEKIRRSVETVNGILEKTRSYKTEVY